MKTPLLRPWLLLVGSAALPNLFAAEPPANSAFVDAQGNTHITRVVPPPATISPESRAKLLNPPPSILSSGLSVPEQRERIDARQKRDAEACLQLFPASIADDRFGGVPVRIVTPRDPDPAKRDRVLINVHGGGFRTDTGSLLESIPIAGLTRTKVVAVLYRLAPEHVFPDAVDDTVAVYRELLKQYRPEKIALYGTSAGAIITGQTVVKLRALGLPLPAVLGIFSGLGDFSRKGDSVALFSLQGLTGTVPPPGSPSATSEYAGKADMKDPVLSPVFADLRGLPPTLFLTSTRDMLLSGTVQLHQAYLRAGVDARLVVFEAQPHAFWLDVKLPESQEANELIARFLDTHLGR